jgi:hypothetical protein
MTRSSARCVVWLMVAVLGLTAAVGCGKKSAPPPKSADECAKAFAEAVSAGDYEGAAKLYDYQAYAKANNDGWDELDAGKRKMIVGKLREGQMAKLQAAFPKGSKVTSQGSNGTYTLSAGGAAAATIQVHQAGDGWLINYSE